MKIKEHLNKENLHHAYLIEGVREEVIPEILAFVESLGVSVVGNPDLYNITTDSFKIEDARNLKAFNVEMSFISSGKKIFIISANSFLLEAQNTLLKMFEEPIENTHFFLIVPDTDILLKTLVSRFYLIKNSSLPLTGEAEKFIRMPLRSRVDYIKEMLAESEDDDEENVSLDSTRSKAIKFLNALEFTLHKKQISNLMENSERRKSHPVIREGSRRQNFSADYFNQIFKVREFLRMPGSSTKSLMESVALVIPVLQ